jgi:hypothetical protein
MKHAALGGAILSLIAAGSVASQIEARESATIAGLAIGMALLVPTFLVVGFQICPRCKKTWNSRGIFGLHTPYTPHCLNCALDVPDPGPAPMLPLAGILAGPSLVALAVLLGVHYFAPHPQVRAGVSVTEVEALRGTSDYVSFADGVPRSDLVGSYVKKKAIYHMAPLVPNDWELEQPVKLWVICRKGPLTGDCVDPARWVALLESARRSGAPLENARVVSHADVTNDDAGWHRATYDAKRHHGVETHPRAIVVEWPGDPSRD